MNRDRRSDRAQTAVDFAIAMGVFLVALTTVVAFMPTMIQPFTGGQETPLVADRTASQLVDDQLGDPNRPGQLNVTCTMYFFNDSEGDPCETFENEGNPPNPSDREALNEKLGVADTRFVNVTMRQNWTGGPRPDLVCGSLDGEVTGPPCSGSDEYLMATGPEPPTESGSVTSARRTARFGSEYVYIEVRVWT